MSNSFSLVKQNSEIIDEEENEESTQGEEESIKLGSVYDLNDCKLFTISEDNENS